MELRRDDLARAAGDPVRRRSDRLATVDREIRQAPAEALGRTGERLQGILDRLARLDRRLALLDEEAGGDAVPPRGEALRMEIETRNRLRDEAVRGRHHLIIQREALGLARHTPVEQCYPVPGRRRGPGAANGRGREP
ncbi:MAG: hypothetical protein L0027_13925 [Candidatus Rokubacteria bacterium]|nr:hypothetical protein [Candidatus Rokubacteria bacterium]